MPNASTPGICCPLCLRGPATHFYRLSGVPVAAASVFTDAAQAREVASGDIDLAACTCCGFAYNRHFDPNLVECTARYESSQAASPHFSAYASATACSLVARHQLESKTILEVGCGNGDFLQHLRKAGVGHAIGVDPVMNVDDVQLNAAGGIELIPQLFDESLLHIDADALICRHTLEHLPAVQEFLTLLRKWAARAPNRVVLVDLPDGERVFAERAFWDIYYEHCNYFTAHTLRRGFELAGFRILSLRHEFQGQYLSVEAVADPHFAAPEPVDCAADLRLYRSFAKDVNASLSHCESALERLSRSPDPLIVWQGSSKTVGFLSALVHPERIDGAVDVNPQRQGIFLPGSGLPVYAPEHLKVLRPQHIILMNSAYRQEVAADLAAMGLPSQLQVIDDLLR